MHDNQSSLGALIQRRMASKGLTQVKVSKLLGLHQAQLSERLTGKRTITQRELRSLAQILEVPVVDLIPVDMPAAMPRLTVGHCIALSAVLGIGLGDLFERLAQADAA